MNTSSTLDFISLLETSRGMPTTSRQSLLEYWAFSQHYLSISTTLLIRSVWTFLTTLISDSSLTKLSLNLRISSRASVFTMLYALPLFLSDKAIPIISLFVILCSLSVCCHCRELIYFPIKVTVEWKVDTILWN